MALAALRRSHREDLARLADEHLQHDLEAEDRDVLERAAGRVSLPTMLGTVVGLGLGLYAAFRLRRLRGDMFTAFRAAEKPTGLTFSGGRTEPLPDLTPYMQPTRIGDWATYFFFGLGGTVLGGELGLALGTWSAGRLIASDNERARRIETAFRRFKADYLRAEAKRLEDGSGSAW